MPSSGGAVLLLLPTNTAEMRLFHCPFHVSGSIFIMTSAQVDVFILSPRIQTLMADKQVQDDFTNHLFIQHLSAINTTKQTRLQGLCSYSKQYQRCLKKRSLAAKQSVKTSSKAVRSRRSNQELTSK